MIKPGSLCYLVGLLNFADLNGRVVTVVGPSTRVGWDWQIVAPWMESHPLTREYEHRNARTRNLLPINDPDEPVTTHTPEALTA